MKRGYLIFIFSFLLLFIGVSAFSPVAPAGLIEDILTQTNKFRQSKGKPALIMKPELNTIAMAHSRHMATGQVSFGHTGFDQRYEEARKRTGAKSFAENVAFGEESAVELVTDWKKSVGHRRNMLGNFRYIGIGAARDRQGRFYFTQVFVD